MAESTALFSVRLPEDLRRDVDAIAKLENRSRSYVVKEAVASYVEDRRAYLAAIDDALKEAEEGIFVSGETVDEWLHSWGSEPRLPVPQPDIVIAKRK